MEMDSIGDKTLVEKNDVASTLNHTEELKSDQSDNTASTGDEKTDIHVMDSNKKTEDSKKQESTDLTSFKTDDVFGYTKADRFTSEVFKIEMRNIPKYYNFKSWKDLLGKKLKLNPHKIKAIRNLEVVYVTFKCEEDKLKAIEVLDGYKLKGRPLAVKVAKPKEDAMAYSRKRSADGQQDGLSPSKKAKEDSFVYSVDSLKNALIPWWNITYEEQLALKHKFVANALTDIRKWISGVKGLQVEVFKYILRRKRGDGVLCPVHPVLPSPIENEYRNKCSFTIGKNMEGQPTVGNRLGRYKDQMAAVEGPSSLIHVPSKVRDICEEVTAYVRQSDLDVYNLQTYQGYWKNLMVRNNREGNIMIVLTLCKQDLSEERIEKEKKKLVECFADKSVTIDTILLEVQPVQKMSEGHRAELSVLTGTGYIYETILDNLKFRISSSAFFQCNTPAAEVLYRTVRELALQGVDTDKDVIVLDVCCGTGTIGLSVAKSVKRVIGVDICEEAVEDAKINAELNKITNVEFLAGKAEDTLTKICRDLPENCEVVAIVDPPRCGLHTKVVAAIRCCHQINKLIYVSCSITQTKQNVMDLLRPKSNKLNGPPFVPELARPLDLFPHTKHVEVVMVFTRVDSHTMARLDREYQQQQEADNLKENKDDTAAKDDTSATDKDDTAATEKQITDTVLDGENNNSLKTAELAADRGSANIENQSS